MKSLGPKFKSRWSEFSKTKLPNPEFDTQRDFALTGEIDTNSTRLDKIDTFKKPIGKLLENSNSNNHRRYGPMDKAPAYGAGDSGFESQ